MNFNDGFIAGALLGVGVLLLLIFFERWRTGDTGKLAGRAPVAGELWAFKDEGPWPNKRTGAKILDIKDGWVRYAIWTDGHAGTYFQDERKQISSFLNCYVPPFD